MSFLVALMVLTIIIYWLRWRPRKNSSEHNSTRPPVDAKDEHTVTVVHRKIPEALVDLRDEAERSFRVVGASHWVHNDVIWQYHLSVFFLHREPDNPYDENAIAVYGGDRKFGYMSAAAAAQYAPILDQLGSDFIVIRDDEDLARMRFRLPRISVLRARIREHRIPTWRLDMSELQDEAQPPAPIPIPKSELTGGYPLIGGPYSNGEQVFGYYDEFAADLHEAGTPPVTSLRRSTITAAIHNVRIGDMLPLHAVDHTLVVSKAGHEVGRLTWKDYDNRFDGGFLEVQRVFIGKIANCAGIALPADPEQ